MLDNKLRHLIESEVIICCMHKQWLVMMNTYHIRNSIIIYGLDEWVIKEDPQCIQYLNTD